MAHLADQLRGRVFTSRYQSSALIAASGAAPMRITLGPPRFRLGYELAGSLPSLAPRKRHFYLHGEAFREQYLADLARRLGVDGVLHLLAQAVEPHGDIVLLCFENVLEGAAATGGCSPTGSRSAAGSSFPSWARSAACGVRCTPHV
jgi:hypothetical protein